MATKKSTTTTPAPHPMDLTNDDQVIATLANSYLHNERWATEWQDRAEAFRRTVERIHPVRFGGNDGSLAWEQEQNEMEQNAANALAEITTTPAATVAGLAIKLRLLERDTEHWQTSGDMIDLFRSALDDAERLAKEGGAS